MLRVVTPRAMCPGEKNNDLPAPVVTAAIVYFAFLGSNTGKGKKGESCKEV